MAVDFNVVKLMNNGPDMNVAADDGPSLVGCLASVDLIMNVRPIELRRERRKFECSIRLELPEI